MSPEFFWELEIKRMARKFTPPEKRVAPPEPNGQPVEDGAPAKGPTINVTAQVDAADFDDAIKTGRIKPPDVEKAREAHKTARELVTGGVKLPEEFDSEFADYHRGAFAFRNGATPFDEARAAWEKLLQRPETERHYRSVWAAFMLGKLAQAVDDHPTAVKWFRRTRELAGKGFADALGLAADSYGWEGRSELRQRHFEAAAKLYLTQLALGDESAIVSLKAVIPDRPEVDGTVSYADPAPDQANVAEFKKWEENKDSVGQQRLDKCARSPVLRQLETAHVLATETQESSWSYGGGYGAGAPDDGTAPPSAARCLRWLTTVEKAGLKQIDDADHLGWVAYTGGRYKEAARWLAMANPTTPTALWLKAKLERRDGKIAPATATMAEAFKAIRADVIPRGESMFTYGEPGYQPEQSAAGDLAALHLTRGEFIDTMDAFLQGDLWADAAFIGDRVLTVDELKKYVDTHYPKAVPPPNPDHPTSDDNGSRMRWMLGRRLVRANRFDEARPYFEKKEAINLDRYVAALKEADNSKLPKMKRAQALFTAAWVARYDGLEIMGTEVEPDGFLSEGNYPQGNLDTERVEGVRVSTEYDDKKQEDVLKKKRTRLSIPPTAAEKQRITANSPHPTRRYHYRWVAADLAWRAAGLMIDGTEELADVLNTGGGWISDRDDKGADKFIQAIERRCPHTDIGKAESAKHWFVGNEGPWSEELTKEEAAAQPDATKPQ